MAQALITAKNGMCMMGFIIFRKIFVLFCFCFSFPLLLRQICIAGTLSYVQKYKSVSPFLPGKSGMGNLVCII